MKKSNAIALFCLVLSGASFGAAPLSVELTVQEPAGIARQLEPVSGGIPLPCGQYPKDQAFAVFDGAKEIPSQVTPLVIDEKGRVNWVLVDIQTDLAANEKKTFTLKTATPAAKPAQALAVNDGADAVTIDTGKIQLSISKTQPFSLLSSVKAGGKALTDGGKVTYVDDTTGTEKTGTAGKPGAVVVEYAGPLRTTVAVSGVFEGDDDSKLRYIARITAWAGRSDIHVKYSLANSSDEHYSWRHIKESSVRMKLAAAADGTVVGAGKPAEAGADAWMQQSMRVFSSALHTDDSLGANPCYRQTPGASGPNGARAMSGDKELWVSAGKADVSEGWLAVKSGGATVFVTDLYFVEDPPRRLEAIKGELVLSGIVQPHEGASSPFNDRPRWLFDCSHLSSQYVIDFQAPSAAAELSAKARAARARIHLQAPPAWYFSTESLPIGKYGTQADELACYEKWGWKYEAKDVPTKASGQFKNVPRWSAGDDNHYTSEQDTVDALVLMYLRTGDRGFYEGTLAWANYFMDLQSWRTDGWRWKDGGTWWTSRGSPIGNAPQRQPDPVTGMRNRMVLPGGDKKAGTHKVKDSPVNLKIDLSKAMLQDLHFLANAKACHCHNWGEGITTWFLITGDRDAFETTLDCAEQNHDTQRRGMKKEPGKPAAFSRDFTRASYIINAARLLLPADPYLIEASDYVAAVYLKRPDPEPRGFLNAPARMDLKAIEGKVGAKGMARMKELGVTFDAQTGELNDPKTGARWMPLSDPHTWMFPPLSKAMDLYYRLTGNEDAQDWIIAYGQAAAYVLFQKKHGNLAYGSFLVDFPTKGFAWDRHSWNLPDDARDGEGEAINGYLAKFYPDVPIRGYEYSGEPFLKQRAYDFWYYGSHRGYNSAKMHNIGRVGTWINVYSTHDETVTFTGRTIYEWSHERKDAVPPKPVADLAVKVDGGKATVSFVAPTDEGNGKVVRYQVKCSDKPIVSYEDFLKAWEAGKDKDVSNWWMTTNLTGEPVPAAAGKKESFVVEGVPANAKYFAVVSFDDSVNRSPLSNVAEMGK